MFTLNDAKIELPKYIFSPGEIITGNVVTYLPSPTKVSEIKLSFYGLYIPPGFGNSGGNEGIIFAKQNIILAKEILASSYMYEFAIVIPRDIYPENLGESTSLPNQYASGWEKIGYDIISELLGTRELSPGYRFFLDVTIDIPWGLNVSKSSEITINPILKESFDK